MEDKETPEETTERIDHTDNAGNVENGNKEDNGNVDNEDTVDTPLFSRAKALAVALTPNIFHGTAHKSLRYLAESVSQPFGTMHTLTAYECSVHPEIIEPLGQKDAENFRKAQAYYDYMYPHAHNIASIVANVKKLIMVLLILFSQYTLAIAFYGIGKEQTFANAAILYTTGFFICLLLCYTIEFIINSDMTHEKEQEILARQLKSPKVEAVFK